MTLSILEHSLKQPVSFPTDFESKLEIPMRVVMDVFRRIADFMRNANQTQNITRDGKQTNETAERRVSGMSSHRQLRR